MTLKNKPSMVRAISTHFFLVFCCLIVLFPVLRAISISFRDTNNYNPATQTDFPARGEATAGDYIKFFTNAFIPLDLFTESEKVKVEAETAVSDQVVVDEEEDDEFADLDAKEADDAPRYWYSNYVDLFTKYSFVQWAYNSLIVSLSAAVLGLLLAATTAYAFSRFTFPGKRGAIGFIITTQMIPGPMLIIPIYLVVKSVGLGNSYVGYVLALTVATVPFSIMILKGYFDTIPASLEEAARVDGCSQASAFFKILLPLSTPALAIAFLFNFVAAWSEFILASTLLDDNELRTWPLGIMAFANNFDARWGIMAAACVVIALPSIAMFLYSAKYMITGMTLGSVKG